MGIQYKMFFDKYLNVKKLVLIWITFVKNISDPDPVHCSAVDTVPYFSYDLILPSHTVYRSPVLLKDPSVFPLLKIKRCYLTYFVTYYDRS